MIKRTSSSYKRQQGFSLVELLIVVAMISLVMAAMFSLYRFHQRSAYVQDDVADVQQNLRIAVESLAQDIHYAGFVSCEPREKKDTLAPYAVDVNRRNGNSVQPIRSATDLTQNPANYAGLLPLTADAFPAQPDRIHADRLDLNFGSELNSCAVINLPVLQDFVTFAAVGGTFPVLTAQSLDIFENNSLVRIIRPAQHDQVTNIGFYEFFTLNGPGTCFRVTALNKLAPSMTVAVDNVTCPLNIDPNAHPAEFRSGDAICRVTGAAYPHTVAYCLGPDANGLCPAPAGAVCNAGGNDRTLCLMKIDDGTSTVLATRISGLQFTYLLDDGTEVPNATVPIAPTLNDLGAIRAVRVTITGQTSRARALEGDTQEKTRVKTSIIKLRNRFMPL
jgi:prepilin-type N-terminal cleavage/methylation domain-containing protein